MTTPSRPTSISCWWVLAVRAPSSCRIAAEAVTSQASRLRWTTLRPQHDTALPWLPGHSSRLTSWERAEPIPGRRQPRQPAGGSPLSVFNGTNANGTWTLYVFDDALATSAASIGGWDAEHHDDGWLRTPTPSPTPTAPLGHTDTECDSNPDPEPTADPDPDSCDSNANSYSSAPRQHQLLRLRQRHQRPQLLQVPLRGRRPLTCRRGCKFRPVIMSASAGSSSGTAPKHVLLRAIGPS